jgi:hypothetical protein
MSGDFDVVKMGNSGRAQIIGSRDVHLAIENGMKLFHKWAGHVDALRPNIISVELFDGDGYLRRFENDITSSLKEIWLLLKVTSF